MHFSLYVVGVNASWRCLHGVGVQATWECLYGVGVSATWLCMQLAFGTVLCS